MPGDILKFHQRDPQGEKKEELTPALRRIMNMGSEGMGSLEHSFWRDVRALLRGPKTPLSSMMHASLLSVLADPKIQKSKYKKLFEQALNELVARNGVQAK